MSINTNNALQQAQSSLRNKASKSNQDNGELGKREFLNLFMTQLSNQDPMSPMDSGAMMSQLAQMGSMEQLENIHTELKTLNSKQSESTRMQALQFLNKDVKIDQPYVEVSHGAGKPVYFTLDKEVTDLRVTVEGKDGSPITTEQLGLLGSGRHQFLWDGKNREGTMMGDGNYNIRLLATFPDGTSKNIDPYSSGRVTNLEYRQGVPWMNIKGRSLPLSAIKAVDTASQQLFGKTNPLSMIRNLQPKGMLKHPTEG
ncbi:MAG: hypothetical protein COB67_03510 [SAR324 cluster bacterium]|uniref:Basal-body rod modification protein FlgD n=1 Tax=SAR324 cluster bacterium TaxID=2024889 RepID=A0A2A4T8J5_9DELT|nr:MAG: hypothetical protein COB67_03510 [SAR324 cluster bacterium]